MNASSGADADGKFGLYGGAGLEFGEATGPAIIAEVLYRWVDKTKVKHGLLEEELDLSGVLGTIALAYRW